ncbi:NAD(P)/FAD-dependent oxidoreductase [Shimia sp. FJ5]|uniref:NAD(P)/FAD-dependent oxidoreductase n=1 Tax=Shimia sp. FJ5 TaxID=3079054 RepID=UPI0026210403|nr:NAD(P)/FAD-dependent oxidoreductase [Shimia sp. FJ5]MDV4144314.1 NAD(P)/FAD-dependent oxidoreductase [Shimia sp. FJ5]
MNEPFTGDRPASRTIIIGAGPAGLTAAYELQKIGAPTIPVVLEASDMVGGISRTEQKNGNRFDIGGHRFFTKVPEVEAMWHEVMQDDFIEVDRLSRIFYRDKFFSYPLKLFNALRNIGLVEAVRILLSYIRWRVRPSKQEDTFEQWVTNRFGRRLYMHFFQSYTRKVWGVDPSEIRSDWAAQRIQNLSLPKAVWNAISGANDTKTLIERFQYPRLGPGMMWEFVRDRVRAAGGEVQMRREVTRIKRSDTRVTSVETRTWSEDGKAVETSVIEGDDFINSMPLRDLIFAFDPPPPPDVVAAAEKLRYRDFLIVTLCLDHPDPFPDNWIYIHSPDVNVARIQNFRAWSPDMLADPNTSSIGMEYFCNQGDALWEMDETALRDLAAKELEALGLAKAEAVTDFAIVRQLKAYPVYDSDYREALEIISAWLKTLENFQTVGRAGLHRYNNQDHSMLSAMYAARNIMGARHDVWEVNTERSYHEDFEVEKDAQRDIAAE